ncbi:hypothetical protein MTR67_019482 [Solanum verrucosum]|uniref:Uncharacterized protein n=1 Tax=Solanum verrucosum TaxID=315347 RepID=A0AAF0QLL2_SOLVR|nr:hypothetical protein MTR67_019482 [Solanum verrucosum]
MQKRKVSLFDVVDDSSALAKKANGSLNGGNSMTPSIDKSVKSLINLPCFMPHVAILVAVHEATKDVRQIPVGIEDVSDL